MGDLDGSSMYKGESNDLDGSSTYKGESNKIHKNYLVNSLDTF